MTTNIGAEFDAIFKPEWLTVVHGVEALATNLEGDAKTALQSAQADLSTALNAAATAVSTAQAQVTAAVNPIVNTGIAAMGTALSTAYPPIAPLVAATEPEVDTLADSGTDTILIAVISKIAGLLSSAGKSAAAINLANLAGAV